MDGLIRFGVGLSLLVPVLSPLAQTAEILQATDASPVVLGQDPGLPSDLFCVRVAGMATETSSRQAAERLSALGYQRIEPRVDGVIHSVEAGVFESTLDAMLCVEDLQRRGFHRVTVERIPTTDSTRAALTRWLPIEPAFTLEARRIEDTPDPQINMESDPLIARGQASEALDTAEGDADLEDLISSLSDDDPRRGWALLRRAHRHREERHWEEALEMFQAVSDGAVAVRRSDRTNAMYRVGWILQYRIGSRRGAYQAFRETELFVDDPVLQARCRAEQAWIMFEMVRYEEIGEWDEVRRFAAQTLAMFEPDGDPTGLDKWIAVSRLIHFETFFYENRYEDVIRFASAYLEDYREVEARRREVGMASAWLGICHMRLGHREEATLAFEDMISMDLTSPTDNFGGENMDVLAATYLFELASRASDIQEMAHWLSYLEERHPSRQETDDLRARLERAVQEH